MDSQGDAVSATAVAWAPPTALRGIAFRRLSPEIKLPPIQADTIMDCVGGSISRVVTIAGQRKLRGVIEDLARV